MPLDSLARVGKAEDLKLDLEDLVLPWLEPKLGRDDLVPRGRPWTDTALHRSPPIYEHR